ncbi:MAG: hypothetical protein IPJ25_11235 [Rhodocyclaceae bacterium]|nr:hypothetical protein [Rhodocyclaceae bacterium]
MLPADKSAALYFYCERRHLCAEQQLGLKAIKLGYTNVKSFLKATPAWEKAYGAELHSGFCRRRCSPKSSAIEAGKGVNSQHCRGLL